MFRLLNYPGVRGRSVLVGTLAAALVCLPGCGADQRPKYAMPNKAANEVAIIVAEYNMLSAFGIDEVDGARVEAPPFAMNYPVKVLPGQRRLKVTGNVGRTSATWSFVYDFQAGHRYALSASSAVFQTGLKLTDKTTNTSINIQ